MMFMMHISSLLAVIALLGSTALVVWARQNKGEGACFAKKIGYASFFLSLLSFICISYYGIKYWAQGDFETPMPMPMHMKMHKGMMEKMMPQMIENMGNMGHTEKSGENKDEPHSHDH